MMLTIDGIVERYTITRASAIIRMTAVSDFGGRYDEHTVKRIMEPWCPLGGYRWRTLPEHGAAFFGVVFDAVQEFCAS